MGRAKGTTLKAMQFKMKQEAGITNNGGGEASFRVLYYGDASAGSVPFMWESHPGTPKHSTTESSLPPLTPPPAFHRFNQEYNSSMHSTSLRTLFLATGSSKTHVSSAAPPSSKISNSLRSLFLESSSRRAHVAAVPPPSYTSLSYSLPSTPMNKGLGRNELRRRRAPVKFGMEEDGDEKHVSGGDDGGSLTSKLCLGGDFMKFCRMKKVKNALMSIVSHGKKKKIN